MAREIATLKFVAAHSEGKNAGNILSLVFRVKSPSSSLISSKNPNHQRAVLLTPPGAIGGLFEGKTPRDMYQGSPALA
jgi:hypothetical protein